MNKIKILAISLIALLISSCAGLNMTPYSNDPVETRVVLSNSNFRVVKMVKGEWEATYVMGIGGLSKKGLTTNAVSELYNNAKLTGSQQIVNITVSHSVKMIFGPIYMQRKAVARGYVIEFTDNNAVAGSVSSYRPTQQTMPSPSGINQPTTATTAQTNTTTDYEINIPDKDFRKVLIKKVDQNKDGEISKSEAMAVTKLDIYNKGITDLSGIEEFENLEILNANKNKITSVNLSNNKKLRQVNVFSKELEEVILSKHNSYKIKIDVPIEYISYK